MASASVSVVLVHGGFVDGSGWENVYKILKKDGYDVSIEITEQWQVLAFACLVRACECAGNDAE